MPAPRSDMTATLVNDLIYIIGGCNHPNGTQLAESVMSTDTTPIHITTTSTYQCHSITASTISYSPQRDTFNTASSLSLTPAPRARYRHAAVSVGGRIWLLGGLDVNGAIIHEVDVYDVALNSWSTPGRLDVVTSDLAAFVWDGYIFFAGGY